MKKNIETAPNGALVKFRLAGHSMTGSLSSLRTPHGTRIVFYRNNKGEHLQAAIPAANLKIEKVW